MNFLAFRIVWGNALIGATPELLAGGAPDEAFKELTGDDEKTVTAASGSSKEKSTQGHGALLSYDLTQVVNQLAEVRRRGRRAG